MLPQQCRQSWSARRSEPINARGSPTEQTGAVTFACVACQELERVPRRPVAVRALVDRKIALEHASLRPERLDTGFDVRPPCRGESVRRRWHFPPLEAETVDTHAQAAELDANIFAL